MELGAHYNGTNLVLLASLTGCLCCLSSGFNAILAQLPQTPIGKGSLPKAIQAAKLNREVYSREWKLVVEGEGRPMSLRSPGEKTDQEPGDTGMRESWLGKKSHSRKGGRGS